MQLPEPTRYTMHNRPCPPMMLPAFTFTTSASSEVAVAATPVTTPAQHRSESGHGRDKPSESNITSTAEANTAVHDSSGPTLMGQRSAPLPPLRGSLSANEGIPMACTRVVMNQIVMPSEVDMMGICIGGQVRFTLQWRGDGEVAQNELDSETCAEVGMWFSISLVIHCCRC
jgi:hypothetical protein